MYTCFLENVEIHKADDNIFFSGKGMYSISLPKLSLKIFLERWLACHVELERVISDSTKNSSSSIDLEEDKLYHYFDNFNKQNLNFEFQPDLSVFSEDGVWGCNLSFSSGPVWMCFPICKEDNKKLIVALQIWLKEIESDEKSRKRS